MSKYLRPDIIYITLVSLLAFVVRLLTVSKTGLTDDESNGIAIAIAGSIPDLIAHLKDDGNAPLTYMLLRLYAGLAGDSDMMMKFAVVFVGTVTVPLVYFLLRNQIPQRLNLQICLLTALSPSLVRWGNLVRPYGMLVIMAFVSTFACIKSLEKNAPKWWIVVYGLSSAGLVYTHYWGGFVPIGQAGLAIIGLCRGWFGKVELKRWLSGVALSLLLFSPQLPILRYQLGHVVDLWDQISSMLRLIPDFLPMIVVCDGSGWESAICTLLLMVAMLAPSAIYFKNKKTLSGDPVQESEKDSEVAFNGKYWKTVTLCGLLACFLVSFFLPAMRFRYTVSFVPLLFVMYVTTIDNLFDRSPRLVRLFLSCGIWVSIFIAPLVLLSSAPETSSRLVVEKIVTRCDRKNTLVFVSWQGFAPAVCRYLPADIDCIAYPDLVRPIFNNWADMNAKMQDPDRLPKLYAIFDKILAGGGELWVIDASPDIELKPWQQRHIPEDMSMLKSNKYRMQQVRSWLESHATQKGKISVAPGRDETTYITVWKRD